MSDDIKVLATRMMRVFQGNKEGHYVADFRNVTIEKNGKRVPVYRDVRGPLTLEEFENHLRGKIGLLVVPVTQGGACRWGKIDIDDYDGDPVQRGAKWAKLIARWGLPLVAELSKSGGVQLAHYSPYTESADDMRAKLADWCATLSVKPGTELFPKQGRLLPGEIGSGINLPYFGGDSDGTRNYAVNSEGRRLTMKEWLDLIENMPATATYVPGQVNVEAAADLLSKYWTDGNRDNLNLAVAGTLLRARVDTDTVQAVLDACMGIAADDGKHADALQIELMLKSGKRVPGFPKLAEYIGQEDAQELMRLMGAEPPPKILPFDFVPAPRSYRNEIPPPLTYTVNPLLPTGVVGMLVAEGGAGKTTFGLRLAVAVAGGRELFGLPTKTGRVVYIACEEHERGLRRRIHWITKRERERMMEEGLSPESIELFEGALDQNLIVRSAVGYEIFLVNSAKGGPTQGPVIQEFINDLPRPLELLILDPISRLSNAEENSNQVGTMLINAAERIAREVETTVLLSHHTGKAAAKDRITNQYAARGASGFADAARSIIRLLQADENDAKEFTNVPAEVIAKGDLVQVIHNKSNEGPKGEPFWLRRQALDFELFTPVVGAGGGARTTELLAALFNWWAGANARKGFSKKRFEDKEALREMFHPHKIGKARAATVVDEAFGRDIVESAVTAPNSTHKLLVFRPDMEDSM